jgi:hypothetical protein
MYAFTEALSAQDQSKILSGIDETLASHLMVFAAEDSRKTGKVINMD